MFWLQDIDTFPRFGYDLPDYERLVEEKTNLFSELMKGGRVRWEGLRSARHDKAVVPCLELPLPGLDRRRRQPRVRDGSRRYGFSLMLTIIAGPLRTAPSATSTGDARLEM